MKLRYKISIIFILFFFFIILNNTNSFASISYQGYSFPDWPDNYDDYDYHYIFYNTNTHNYLLQMSKSPMTISTNTTGGGTFRYSYLYEYKFKPENGDTTWRYSFASSSSSGSNTVTDLSNYPCIWAETDILNGSDVYFEANTVDYFYNHVITTWYNTSDNNIFELNLIDKNFSDTQHKFYLKSDSNSSGYDELMTYINAGNNYTIYLTDYVRYLTFENTSIDCPISDGHYKISGYIDFLISEQAYFYFSPHYNRIKICSGDYRGEDLTTYTKRFFFTLVASEDSSDVYFDIYDDNGYLWSLSDYVNDGNTSISDTIEDISNSYFIGSNQTIYYAKEDSNYILDSLTDSIYYIGCNGTGKTRGEDTRVYNFGFSGGHTKQFFLSDDSFDSDVSDANDEISSKKDSDDPIVYDTTNGQSVIVPVDSTSYTYIYNTITDDTDTEDDSNNIETERSPYTSDTSTEDDSNWSILDYFKYFFRKSQEDENEANETSGSFTSALTTLLSTFSFYEPIVENVNDIIDYIVETEATHKYYLDIDSKYFSGNICILDLSWYEPYKETGDAIICAFAYLSFTWHVFCRIPNLISGSSIGTYIGDIEKYFTINKH